MINKSHSDGNLKSEIAEIQGRENKKYNSDVSLSNQFKISFLLFFF